MTADDRRQPRALLVGGTGFVGGHLARRLAGGWQVTRTGRDHDIRDLLTVRALVNRVRPDVVVNLAALTTVRETESSPVEAHAVTVGGLGNLLEALADEGFAGRLLQVSSSEVYGHPEAAALPLTERSATDPKSPYATTKLAAEALCRRWADRMDIVIARPFTHIGPGQSERFAVANWARQLARIEAGLAEPAIKVGALDATRDLTDVRDVAAAYELMLLKGRRGATYNVCYGREVAMREVLDALVSRTGLEVRIRNDPARLRAADQKRLRGDAAALTADTGWTPQFPLIQTLSDVLQDAKGHVRQEPRPA